MILPSKAEIEALHRTYAPSEAAYRLVHTHCEIVWAIAQQLLQASQTAVDADLVRVGCLLHDIGAYRFETIGGGKEIGADYIQHGVLGYDILKAEGLPETICRFAAHHTGVGFTKQEIIANNMPLPHRDLLAETPEERLIMYADKFNSKSEPPRFNSHESYRQHVARFGSQKPLEFDALAKEFGKPDLAPLATQYGQPIV